MESDLHNLSISHDVFVKKLYKRLEFALKFRRSK